MELVTVAISKIKLLWKQWGKFQFMLLCFSINCNNSSILQWLFTTWSYWSLFYTSLHPNSWKRSWFTQVWEQQWALLCKHCRCKFCAMSWPTVPCWLRRDYIMCETSQLIFPKATPVPIKDACPIFYFSRAPKITRHLHKCAKCYASFLTFHLLAVLSFFSTGHLKVTAWPDGFLEELVLQHV